MKYVMHLNGPSAGTVIDADTLQRFIDVATSEDDPGKELRPLARYVADRLADLLAAEG